MRPPVEVVVHVDAETLCRRHHRFLHEHGYRVEHCADDLVFRDPEGRVIPPQGERSGWNDGVERLRAELTDDGIEVSPRVNAPGWDGTAVDHDLCVSALL